jgi:hypothetical protein
MRPEHMRLRRLQRLERVRAIAKHDALRAAASAEGSLSQLLGLARRTAVMAEDYRARTGMSDALALAQHLAFLGGLTGIHTATSGDAEQAQALADRRQEELAMAERRRAAVEDRARDEERQLAQRRLPSPLGARRAVGTGLE